ncbi:MAG: signal peptidase I [Candidatus Sungbacteria bacterium]|uniref:Signal peptidase I n=1 Tax=Candidatus Sungiibacteriota bacterium TaxID=2750080 RepID=A0A933DSP3_9BACT|nr:signal peptidase I [Candidatus Sungbacteria bacterium]
MPSESSAPASPFLRALGEFLRLAVIAAAIALPIRYFIAQPFIVRGASMEPNFHDREYLVIDEFSYFFRPPQRGEVIVFRYPLNPREYFIKRVIGLPGETVEVRVDAVYVFNGERPDGFKLDEPYLSAGLAPRGNIRFTIGPDEYVVLGDNRSASSDSRNWGALERRFITGRAVFRAWPVSRLGSLVQPL